MLKIGWSSRDVTPTLPIMLHGQFHTRIGREARDPLTITALALEGAGDACALMLSCDVVSVPGETHEAFRKELAKRLLEEYTSVKIVAITLRESFSADHNDWSATCYSRDEGKARISKKYYLKDIVDRVGGGDSFGSGFIYGLYSNMELQDALEFAVAASALKHTIIPVSFISLMLSVFITMPPPQATTKFFSFATSFRVLFSKRRK